MSVANDMDGFANLDGAFVVMRSVLWISSRGLRVVSSRMDGGAS
jgi:hypothetical protein